MHATVDFVRVINTEPIIGPRKFLSWPGPAVSSSKVLLCREVGDRSLSDTVRQTPRMTNALLACGNLICWPMRCGFSTGLATGLSSTVICVFCAIAPSVAGISNLTGAAHSPFPLPLSVLQDHTESDFHVFVLPEQKNLKLPVDLSVDITIPVSFPGGPLSPNIIPAGTTVSSYLLHADREGNMPLPPLKLNGSVAFEEMVLGMMFLSGSLSDSDGIVGALAVQGHYPTGQPLRGMRLDASDLLQWSGNTIEFNFQLDSLSDQVRIITAPEPEGVTFSIDVQGPTAGSFGSDDDPPAASFPSTGSFPISGGDILTVGQPGGPGPNPPLPGPLHQPDAVPGIAVLGGDGIGSLRGLDLSAVVIGPLNELETEIDALSYGRDQGNAIRFSVDEFVKGNQIGLAPNELIFSGAGGISEASADVFTFRGSAVPRVLPTEFSNGNTRFIDGDASDIGSVGLGLIEPNVPNPIPPPVMAPTNEFDHGDNLDAMDLDTTVSDIEGNIYFSLDGGFTDPFETGDAIKKLGPNIGTALANPVSGIMSGAAILVSVPGLGKKIYATPAELGLDFHCGEVHCGGTDDVDALVLRDVGDPTIFDPHGDGDFLLFSVRRGSAVIGKPDSRLEVPIEEGDVLMAPLPGANVPQIFIPAEVMGLASARSGSAQGGAGEDIVAMDFALTSLVDGDMDCSGLPLNADDIDAFALAIRNADGYASDVSLCLSSPVSHGNFDGDFDFDFDDITGFVNEFTSTEVTFSVAVLQQLASLPEPTGVVLAVMSLVFLAGYGRRSEGR